MKSDIAYKVIHTHPFASVVINWYHKEVRLLDNKKKMSRTKYIETLESELIKLNEKIDRRIAKGQSYKDLQPVHRALLARIKTA